MEPIFEAVLANDPSRITPAGAAQRIDEDLLVTELPHMLYRGASSSCWFPPAQRSASRTAAG